MIQIYSDFRGLIWRNSTVGRQTFSGTKPLCCLVPSDFLFFPVEHTLNSACFGIGGLCFSRLNCCKAPEPGKPESSRGDGQCCLWPVCWIPPDRWLFVVWLCLCSEGERKKGVFRGKNRQELRRRNEADGLVPPVLVLSLEKSHVM